MRLRLSGWYGRHKRAVWVMAALVMGYSLAGFVATPMVVARLLEGRIARLVDRRIEVDRVRANPYTFSLRLFDLSVADGDGGDFVVLKTLSINAQPLASLFRRGIVVKSLRVAQPAVRIVRSGPREFNFSDLMAPSAGADAQAAKENDKPMRLIVQQFTIEQGRIDFVDQAASAPFATSLSSVEISLDRLDTAAEAGAARFQVTARSEAGEDMAVTGQVDASPLDLAADFVLAQLQIPKYAPYYGSLMTANISRGALDLKGRVRWASQQQSVDEIDGALRQLDVTAADGRQPLIQVPELKVAGAAVDIRQRTVQLGRLSSRDGKVLAARDAQGVFNLAALGPATSPSDGPGAPRSAPDTPGWTVGLPHLQVTGYSLAFKDAGVSPPADLKLTGVAINARDLTTQRDARGAVDLNLAWADQGRLKVEGEIGLVPFQAALDLAVRDLDVRPLQPYINERIQLVVTRGSFGTQGRLEVLRRADGPTGLRYSGQAAVNAFQSVDPKQSGDFLKWKSLFLQGLELDTAPFRLNVRQVSLTDFFNRLIIFKDGTSNLQAILGGGRNGQRPSADVPPMTADTQGPPPDGPPDIRIKTVILQGGRVDFSDHFIKPNVRLPMSDIGGRISNLDAIQTNRADVLLRGMVNTSVPMEIRGRINPLIARPYVDLKLDFAGIDLSPFTPYSGKYLGYTLDKGQLSLNLSYLVSDNKLSGENKVLLKQLTLGQPVASQNATKLPIKFAIALLKDRKGNIDLDLPVAGDLNDPEFSLGGIILKMFANLVVNIVTSPFKVLGALFGGGEELAYLDFEPGSGGLPADGKAKLDALAGILAERPGLNLEIQGQVDRERDLDGLRRLRFEQDLKAAKLNAMVARGKAAVPSEQIALTPAEREPLLREAYAAAQFPKPRDEKGRIKKLSPAEMEKLLYTAIVLTDDDLRLLAHQRAAAAKTYLQADALVAPQRLFVVEPDIEAPDGNESRAGRVKFNLK